MVEVIRHAEHKLSGLSVSNCCYLSKGVSWYRCVYFTCVRGSWLDGRKEDLPGSAELLVSGCSAPQVGGQLGQS